MNLTKTTLNYASARGFALDIVEGCGEDEDSTRLWVFSDVDACEPDFSYIVNSDGSFSWYDNLALPADIKEEMPGTIKDEKHLRLVIKWLAETLPRGE